MKGLGDAPNGECRVPSVSFTGPECIPGTGVEYSFDFKNKPVRETLLEIFQANGLVNFAIDRDLRDCKVTGRFRHVPWDQVLSLVLQSCKLGQVNSENNVVRVGNLERLKNERGSCVLPPNTEITNDRSGQKTVK